MKNLKELKSILTSIYCINFTGHKDPDIALLCQYAFNRIFDSNTNLISLACVGRKKNEIMPELDVLLKEETKYLEYKEKKNG